MGSTTLWVPERQSRDGARADVDLGVVDVLTDPDPRRARLLLPDLRRRGRSSGGPGSGVVPAGQPLPIVVRRAAWPAPACRSRRGQARAVLERPGLRRGRRPAAGVA